MTVGHLPDRRDPVQGDIMCPNIGVLGQASVLYRPQSEYARLGPPPVWCDARRLAVDYPGEPHFLEAREASRKKRRTYP
jgi:hypothetical protein